MILSGLNGMKLPYSLTGKILELVASISEKIGELNSAHLSKPPTELRRKTGLRPFNRHSKLKEISALAKIDSAALDLELNY